MTPRSPSRPFDERLFTAPPSISLRFARPADAEYMFGLRTNPVLNAHLSSAPASVEEQRRYLEGYVDRETQGKEYYFVILDKRRGEPCGVVRLYDLRPDSFCWGSWILDAGKPRLAAVESALFVYDFGFGALGYRKSHFDVRRDNTSVISFHLRFGAIETSSDALNKYFNLDLDDFRKTLPGLTALTGYELTQLAA